MKNHLVKLTGLNPGDVYGLDADEFTHQDVMLLRTWDNLWTFVGLYDNFVTFDSCYMSTNELINYINDEKLEKIGYIKYKILRDDVLQ